MADIKVLKINGENIIITSLYGGGLCGNKPDVFYLGAGIYEQNCRPYNWTGEGYSGEIPYGALIKWALKKGYLQRDGERRD